ncbi:hypothetical protein JHK82_050801 [Glycine max]|nr:hypothetical protein JHK82_050801 [Glycine max]
MECLGVEESGREEIKGIRRGPYRYGFWRQRNGQLLEIPFSNSRLFPHADNPLLQETPSKFVKYRSGVDVGGHVELHLPVTRVAIVIHHAAQVFVRAKGLSHALSRCLNVVVKRMAKLEDLPIPNHDTLEAVYGELEETRRRFDVLWSKFVDLFGDSPEVIGRSPGRVNLIGEHID